MNDDCSHRLLAQNRQGRIELCSHGTLHVTFGALTLRVTPRQLGEVFELVEEARRHLAVTSEPERRLLC